MMKDYDNEIDTLLVFVCTIIILDHILFSRMSFI
jgi:hypothetical protein